MSFASDYKKCFQQEPEPFGFSLLNGTDAFGKLVNDEILLYIFYDKRRAFQQGNKAFTIIAGVQTIYSYELSMHQLQFSGSELINFDVPESDNVPDYLFEYNNSNLAEVIDKALNQTLLFVIPELMKVTNLNACVEYLGRHRSDLLYNADKCCRDSVLLIMTENKSEFTETLKSAELSMLKAFRNDAANPYYQSGIKDLRSRFADEFINSRNKVISNPSLRQAALNEAHNRTENNIILLKKYGLL